MSTCTALSGQLPLPCPAPPGKSVPYLALSLSLFSFLPRLLFSFSPPFHALIFLWMYISLYSTFLYSPRYTPPSLLLYFCGSFQSSQTNYKQTRTVNICLSVWDKNIRKTRARFKWNLLCMFSLLRGRDLFFCLFLAILFITSLRQTWVRYTFTVWWNLSFLHALTHTKVDAGPSHFQAVSVLLMVRG